MSVRSVISDLQDFYDISLRGLLGMGSKPFYFKDAIMQMDYAGSGSLMIVLSSTSLLVWPFPFSCLQSSRDSGSRCT